VIKISGGRVIGETISEKNVYIKEGKIFSVTEEELPFDKELDACGNYVSPGFIDTHLHGGGGFDFMDGDEESVKAVADFHLSHGSTIILPTTLSGDTEEIINSVKTIKRVFDKGDTNIWGVHLEGPYFSKNQAGAQDPRYIRTPKKEEYEKIINSCQGFIKKVSFAPELEEAEEFLKFLAEQDIIASAGHTDATIEDIKKARELGLNMVTHLYSGMSTITRHKGHRILGTVEAAYLFDDIYTEVIADACHLPPDLLKLIYKIKGKDRICLVTDAMRGAGQTEGETVLGKLDTGLKCIVENAVAYLPDKSSFAGSVATADRLVRVMKNDVGVSLTDAVKMMTRTPAIAHKIYGKGEIKKGYDADLLIFDENINIKNVILKGKIVK